jgi:hypothetical protein
MYARSSGSHAGWLALALLLACGVAQALPAGTRAFDKTTWQKLKKEIARPSVGVFTETVAKEIRKGPVKAQLAVVVMDGARQPESWLKEPHYRKADVIYVFDGQETALRFGIDPKWRGMTPYLALFDRTGDPRFVIGPPSAQQLSALLKQ